MAKDTIASYRRKVRDLLNFNPMPDEFSVKAFLVKKRQALLEARGETLSDDACNGTLANYVKAYRSFFGYLFANHLYTLNPYWHKIFNPAGIKLPKVRYSERRVPRDHEKDKLLSTLNSLEDTVAVLLLVDSGIRIHELETIKLDDIDLDDASIIIKNGKGGKQRIVYLTDVTVSYLRTYIQSLSGQYLFPSTRSDAISAYRNRTFFERRLRVLCKQAGIEGITPHQLRHYFATSTLSRGADIKAVSEMLGHADVTITLKIYHHVNAKAIRQMHKDYSPLNNTMLALPKAIKK